MKSPRGERGITMIELLVVVTLGLLIVTATAATALPWIARERMRSAIYDVQTFVQIARVEAVSRDQDCRFVIDTDARDLWVMDSVGTSTRTDDVVLHSRKLPDWIEIDRPDAGAAVTMQQIGTTDSYEVVFTSDGIASSGAGEVCLFGGERYGRLTVFGAGGVLVERWDGSSWNEGS
ncbi:MAG: GspH/FimT family pseudopilin [Acidobacteriota bacterium]|nr:GspH/FimT family pseudopilin [Acidobacteriota bacterium]